MRKYSTGLPILYYLTCHYTPVVPLRFLPSLEKAVMSFLLTQIGCLVVVPPYEAPNYHPDELLPPTKMSDSRRAHWTCLACRFFIITMARLLVTCAPLFSTTKSRDRRECRFHVHDQVGMGGRLSMWPPTHLRGSVGRTAAIGKQWLRSRQLTWRGRGHLHSGRARAHCHVAGQPPSLPPRQLPT